MSESIAGSHSTLASPPRPTLGPLIVGTAAACILSAYFLIDTLILRQPVTQTTADGRNYVLRLYEPAQAAPHLKAAGAQLVASIGKAKDEAIALRAEVAERAVREQHYQAEVEGLREQLALAEQMLAELKSEVQGLPQAFEELYALRAPSAKSP